MTIKELERKLADDENNYFGMFHSWLLGLDEAKRISEESEWLATREEVLLLYKMIYGFIRGLSACCYLSINEEREVLDDLLKLTFSK